MSTSTFNNINDTFTDPEDQQVDLGGYDPSAADKQYPADPRPGVHDFQFHLQTGEGYDKQPFEIVEKGPTDVTPRPKALRVHYKATYTVTKQDGGTFERTLNFLSADFYQSPKMKEKNMPSEGTKLLSALGYDENTDGKFIQSNVETFLRNSDLIGKPFRAKTGLRYYDKAAETEFTTNPNKGNLKHQIWPKTETGEWKLFFNNSEGKRVSGNPSIIDLFKAKK